MGAISSRGVEILTPTNEVSSICKTCPLNEDQLRTGSDMRFCNVVFGVLQSANENDCPELVEMLDELKGKILNDEVGRDLIRKKIEDKIEELGLNDSVSFALKRGRLVEMREINLVLDGLYISAQHPTGYSQVMKQHGITHICSCLEVEPLFPRDFEYLVLPLEDVHDQDIRSHFDKTFNFISKARKKDKGRVLVHCAAGISRSSTIIIAYLMREYALSLEDALVMTRNARPFVQPNDGFFQQLRDYEEYLNQLRGQT
jgi:predicted protein tyrosine phosphatase